MFNSAKQISCLLKPAQAVKSKKSNTNKFHYYNHLPERLEVIIKVKFIIVRLNVESKC